SRSPTELQPVLDAIAATAARLCESMDATVWRVAGGRARRVAQFGSPTSSSALPLTRGSVTGRAIVDRKTIHVHDLAAMVETEYPDVKEVQQRIGHRTTLATPLLSQGEALGAISARKNHVHPFSDRQIALLQTFADQAVIAIENARLFEEVQARTRDLTEALEQQTATSEVLEVISRSPSDLGPVLDTIVKTAARLCQAESAFIWKLEGNHFCLAAMNDIEAELAKFALQHPPPLDRKTTAGRCVLERRTIHIRDALEDSEYVWRGDEEKRIARGYRTLLGIPLLGRGEPFGAFVLIRRDVKPFTNRQIKLGVTFADQAVIAIENTRLFEEVQTRTKELQESLEYQTATSDVLGVISRSKFDLQPVLDSIVETAARLCACDMATIRGREGDVYVQLGGYGLPAEYADYSRSTNWHHAGRGSLVGRVLQEGKAVQIVDVLADPEYSLDEAQRRGGFRTMLGVPLLRGDEQLGIIVLMRRAVRPFDNRQIELVAAFADQAVIAIENTRLFEEVQARTRELATTIQELEIASQHKSQFVANMSHELRTPLTAVLGYAELLQEGIYGALPEKSLPILTRIRSNGQHLLGLINTVLDISKIEAG
ncbi:MAG: GAF domain-containing protein, partial [Hyphomicrobiaceae bacterium]